MAGINAASNVKDQPPLILYCTEAYTAILIDDLISKGTNSNPTACSPRARSSAGTLRIDNAYCRQTAHGLQAILLGKKIGPGCVGNQTDAAAVRSVGGDRHVKTQAGGQTPRAR